MSYLENSSGQRDEVRKDEKVKLNYWKGDYEGIAKGIKDIDWTTVCIDGLS